MNIIHKQVQDLVLDVIQSPEIERSQTTSYCYNIRTFTISQPRELWITSKTKSWTCLCITILIHLRSLNPGALNKPKSWA